MTFPFFGHDLFGGYTGYLVGTLVGIAFGFTLERAGFGSARILTAQFYLTNMRVLKVMFTAVATCAAAAGTSSTIQRSKSCVACAR